MLDVFSLKVRKLLVNVDMSGIKSIHISQLLDSTTLQIGVSSHYYTTGVVYLSVDFVWKFSKPYLGLNRNDKGLFNGGRINLKAVALIDWLVKKNLI